MAFILSSMKLKTAYILEVWEMYSISFWKMESLVQVYSVLLLVWCESHSVVSDSLWPCGLYSPWNSPGQNTRVGGLSVSRGSSQPRDQTQVSRIADGFFASWATREAHFCKGQMVNISVSAGNMWSRSHLLLSFTTLYKSKSHFEITNHTKSGWWAWYGLASVCGHSLLTSAFNQCTHCFSGCELSGKLRKMVRASER